LAGLVLLPVGVVTGIASLAVHDRSWPWFLLAVAGPVVAAVALPPGWPRSGFGLGWVGVLMVALLGRPEGDYVVTATARGYTLLGLGLLLLVLVIVTLPVGRRSARPH
jgi:hypothetical protein